jgi:DNA-binding transcriptional ArsR family regulator
MLRIDFAISPELADALMEVARYDALCDAYPLLPHLRRQIEERGDLRWIWAVALREGMHRTGHEILQALQKRSPACIAPWEPVVCRIGELAALVRKLGRINRTFAPSILGKLHELLDPDPAFRTAGRTVWFVAGVPELGPRKQMGEHLNRLFDWLDASPLGRSPVIGPAIAHQELMHLCPFPARSIATVDAFTRLLLMQRRVNRAGIAVPERVFVTGAETYANAIRRRGRAGREQWVLYFARALAAALRAAWKQIEAVSDQLERRPGLDAAPISERRQTIFELLLRKRQASSTEIAEALGERGTNMRMVQRDLVRLGELGLIERLGARKNAWYRPRGLAPDGDFEPIEDV